jgi:pyridoxal phosphate enzyme (YggS family)
MTMPTTTTSAQIHAAVAAVRAEIAAACARAGRQPESVRLIAVTKNQKPAVLAALVEAGIEDVGENRVEHQTLMHAAAQAAGLPLRFHAIGRLQGRQLNKIAPLSDVCHSLAETDHVARLARACSGRRLPVFLQVNTSGEASKAGGTAEALAELLAAVRAEPTLEAVGLMTMAAEGATERELRQTFSRLRELAAVHGLPRLSMGMSQDFQLAIEEGATDIRIGTRLFT